MSTLNIGVVGYSGQKFDEEQAKALLSEAFNEALRDNPDATEIYVISGLTDLGIPALAYRIAVQNGWKTVGIACSQAEKYECFKVDECVIIGDNWGDESDDFLRASNVIVRVGGGKQSLEEVATFKKNGGATYERELAAIAS